MNDTVSTPKYRDCGGSTSLPEAHGHYLPMVLKLCLIGILSSIHVLCFGQPTGPGDIAFVGFNADGSDGFAFVSFVDIPTSTTIYFNDNEWNGLAIGAGGIFNTGEGAVTWTNDTGCPLMPGTVIYVDAPGSSPLANLGTAVESSNGFSIGASSEVLYAFMGSDDDTPTAFLAAIANNDFGSGSIANTGLSEDDSAIRLDIVDSDADVAIYSGSTICNSTLSDCRLMVTDLTSNGVNWMTQDASGDQSQDGTGPEFPTPNGGGTGVPTDFTGSLFSGSSCLGQSISARDTTICLGADVCLEDLLTGGLGGALNYGTTFGMYPDTITTKVTPSFSTTYFVRDTVFASCCADTAMITVTILPIDTTDIAQTTCSNELIIFNSNTINTSGVYLDTLTQNNGCDSIIRLTLTVNQVDTTDITQTICSGEYYNFNNANLTSQGIYLDTLDQLNGCDSIIRLALTVLEQPPLPIVTPITLCFGDGTSTEIIPTVAPIPGVGPFNVIWNFEGEVDTAISDNILVEGLDASVGSDLTTKTYPSGNASVDALSTRNWNGEANDYLEFCITATSLDVVITSFSFFDDVSATGPDSFFIFSGEDNFTNPIDSGMTHDPFSGTANTTDPLSINVSAGTSFCFRTGTDIAVTTGTFRVDDVVITGNTIAPPPPLFNFYSDDSGTPISGAQGVSSHDPGVTAVGSYDYWIATVGGLCSSDTVMTSITIRPIPNISGIHDTICAGASINLENLITGTPLGSLYYGTTFGNYNDTITSPVSPTVNTAYFIIDSVSATTCVDTTMLTVVVHQIDTTDVAQTTCSNEPIIFNANTINIAGVYLDTLTQNNGCDSIIRLTLTVNQVDTTDITQTICSNEPIIFNSNTIHIAGVYLDTLTQTNGCDSIIRLTLTVNQVDTTDIAQIICSNEPIIFNTNTINTSGVYLDTLQQTNGCDSIIRLTLSVNQVDTTDITQTICSDEYYNFNNTNLTSQGIYLDTLDQSNGCDSIIRLTLTVLEQPPLPIVTPITLCFGDGTSTEIIPTIASIPGVGPFNVIWNFEEEVDTAISDNIFVEGLDVSVGTDLTTKTYPSGNASVDALSTRNWNGEANDYLEFCIAATSLDIVITSFSFFDDVSARGPDSFFIFSGEDNFTNPIDSGMTHDPFSGTTNTTDPLSINVSAGTSFCFRIGADIAATTGTFRVDDITITGDVIAPPPPLFNFYSDDSGTPISGAQGVSSYDPGVTAVGAYDYWIATDSGLCSSDTVMTSITIHPMPNISGIHDTICAGESINLENLITGTPLGSLHYGTTFGNYNDTITSPVSPTVNTAYFIIDSVSATSCVDTAMLTIIVHQIDTTDIAQTTCSNEPIIFNANTINASGVYLDTLTQNNGCDSIIRLTLSVNQVDTTNIAQTICSNEPIIFNANAINTSGLYFDTLTQNNGCDSIIRLTLTVNQVDTADITQTICSNEPIIFNANAINTSGVYFDNLTQTNGCDSIIRLTLTVNQVDTTDIAQIICSNEPIIFNSNTINTSGVYLDTLPQTNGCDSIIRLTLSVNQVDTTDIAQTICSDEYYNFNNANLTSQGVYLDTLDQSNSCDSIIRLTLTVLEQPPLPIVTPITLCFGDGTSTEIIPTIAPIPGVGPFNVIWDFEGEVDTAISDNILVEGLDVSVGTDLTTKTYPSGNASVDALSTRNWNGEANDYLEFCIAATSLDIVITSFSFFDDVSATGPDSFFIFSAEDNFTNPIDSGATHDPFSGTANTTSPLSINVSVGTSFCFRISTDVAAITGTFRVDDITIAGNSIAPPPPLFNFYSDDSGTPISGAQRVSSYDPGVTAVGTYDYWIATDGGLCSGDTVMTSIAIHPMPNISGSHDTICAGESINLENLIIGAPLGSLQYGTTFGNYNDTITSPVSPLATTTYYLRDSVYFTGCTDTTIIVVTVLNPSLRQVGPQFNMCPDKAVDLTTINLIDQNSVPSIPSISYFQDSLDAVNNINEISDGIARESGTYFIRYEVLGCFDIAGIEVIITKCCSIEISFLETICYPHGLYDIRLRIDYDDQCGNGLVIKLDDVFVDTIAYPHSGSTITISPTEPGDGTGQIAITAVDTASLNAQSSIPPPFISEIHYDNIGTDIAEGIEISGAAGSDLGGYQLILYNGSNGMPYDSYNLSGIIANNNSNCGAIFIPISDIQNGPDAIALIDTTSNTLIEFISYEGIVIGTGGAALGQTSLDIGVAESSSTPIGHSLQLENGGWIGPSPNSNNDYNNGLTCIVTQLPPPVCSDTTTVDIPFCPTDCNLSINILESICLSDATYQLKFELATFNTLSDSFVILIDTIPIDTLSYPPINGDTICTDIPQQGLGMTDVSLTVQDLASTAEERGIFISELHYDNGGPDVNEAIEITAPASTNLIGYRIVLYNGDNGLAYRNITLEGIIPDQSSGCGARTFLSSGIQNGPDGIALVAPNNKVLEFLSYEGSFTAMDGPAVGINATDIGVLEDNNTASDQSLQKTDAGWSGPLTQTYNILNSGLSCIQPTPLNICNATASFDAPDCPLFDLSVTKNLSSGQANTIAPGDTVSFDITITNDGAVTAYDIVVRDNISSHFIYDTSINDARWLSDSSFVSVHSIAPGEDTTVAIRLVLNIDFVGFEIENSAEIIFAALVQGGPLAPDLDDDYNNGSGEDFDNIIVSVCHDSAIPMPIIEDISSCSDVGGSVLLTPYAAHPIALFEDFESEGLGNRYHISTETFSDGAGDYLTRTDGSNTDVDSDDLFNIQGAYWFGAQDIDGEGGPSQVTITFSPGDIRGLCNLELSVLIAEDDASDGNEDWDGQDTDNNFVHFDYSVDGVTFYNGIHIESSDASTNTTPRVDSDFDGIGEGQEITSTFQSFTTPINQSGDSIIIRITINLEDGDEDIAFDNILISGTPALYNFYDSDPEFGGSLLASSTSSYESTLSLPGQSNTFWVSTTCGLCEGPAQPVEVFAYPGVTSLACYDEINLVLDENCSIAEVDLTAFYTSDIDPIFMQLAILSNDGIEIPITNLREYVGTSLKYQIKDTCSHLTCWGYLNLESKSIPEPIVRRDTLCCISSVPSGIVSSIDDITSILEKKCLAPFDQVRIEKEVTGGLCDTIEYQYRYYADFYNDQIKNTALVYQHFILSIPLSLSDIMRPGSESLIDSIALADTIEIEACSDFDFSPDNIASYWSSRLDPSDRFRNGNNEGIPFAYPHIVKDSIEKELLTVLPRVRETIIEDSLIQVNGLWISADVILKDTILDTTISLTKIPDYLLIDTTITCNFDVSYTDVYHPGCIGDTKLIRDWTILDWCNGAIKQFRQFIKLKDTEAPEFNVIRTNVVIVNPDSILIDGVSVDVGDPDIMVDIDFEKLFQIVDIINPVECSASFEVPIFDKLTDNCTAFEDITYTYFLEGEQIYPDPDNDRLLHDIPAGSSSLEIVAYDQCGNSASHTMTLFGFDRTPPQVICKDEIHVGLIDDEGLLDGGRVLVPLELFDQGTTDLCGDILLVLARRLDNKFFCNDSLIQAISVSALEFCCEDIGDTIPISLTYFDNFGNTSECWSTIIVEDKFTPALSISDTIIKCSEDTGPTTTGYPTITSLCHAGTYAYLDDRSQYDSLCGSGQILRTWYIPGVPLTEELQVIKIEPDTHYQFNPYHIKWPKNYTGTDIEDFLIYEFSFSGDTCLIWPSDSTSIICAEYPTVSCLDNIFDAPLYDLPKCNIVASNYEDFVQPNDYGGCSKIIRKWTIIDWCSYSPNQSEDATYTLEFIKDNCNYEEYYRYKEVVSNGIYHYEQTIEVVDNDSPVISDCSNTLGYVSVDCMGTAVLTATFSDSSQCSSDRFNWSMIIKNDVDEVIENMEGDVLNGETIHHHTPNLRLGRYQIEWSLRDGCSNESVCTQVLDIIDTIAPLPYCLTNISTVLMSNDGSVTIWPADVDHGAEDNCSNINLYFKNPLGEYTPSLTLTCLDVLSLGGSPWDGYLYAVDSAGNVDSCSVAINIQGDTDVCINGGTATIKGKVFTPTELMIEDVIISVDQYSEETDAAGTYGFPDMPMYQDYVLSAGKNDDVLNGVSAIDVVMIQRHILGIEVLTSPYLKVAADINNDGSISALDLAGIRSVILGRQDEFPNNDSWRFMDATHKLSDATFSNFKETVDIQYLDRSIGGANFVGIKIGDVSGDVTVSTSAKNRSIEEAPIIIEDRHIELDYLVRIAITLDDINQIIALQVAIRHDGLMLVEVSPGAIDISNEEILKFEGRTNILWHHERPISLDDQALFYLTFKAEKSGILSDLIELAPATILPRLYTSMDQDVALGLTFTGKGLISKQVSKLYQNRPNPFSKETSIGFDLAEAGEVKIHIADLAGNTIFEFSDFFKKGYNMIKIDNNQLTTSGILLYKLETEHYSAFRKMIYLK